MDQFDICGVGVEKIGEVGDVLLYCFVGLECELDGLLFALGSFEFYHLGLLVWWHYQKNIILYRKLWSYFDFDFLVKGDRFIFMFKGSEPAVKVFLEFVQFLWTGIADHYL